MNNLYDVIVVGGGHAGCEAAHIAAKMGAKTLLITMDMTKLAQMSCNPAMGGIAKGQIVREIDALGGMSGVITDRSMIQFRMLNRSKGPAMWSPRAQCDRQRFTIEWRKVLENTKELHIWQEMAKEIIVEDHIVCGVECEFGTKFFSKTVILTNGTFLNGLMHIGFSRVNGGRSGDASSYGISDQLRKIGFTVGRMKTGTSARVDGRSIDFSKLIEQFGDKENRKFSYGSEERKIKEERSCFITHTNENVHEELRKGLEFSPLFTGKIKGRGPRYCPSIEDKIVTFKDKSSHQIFIEPEGIETIEYYINGFSSSLPLEVQLKALRKVNGLESVEIFRPGYAIEYDFFQPTQLHHTLETKRIKNLYFAGQINGTTGYEEAASQGLIAGINAVLNFREKSAFVMGREESYIGVLIDDLVTKGVDEPYRMFTARAEYRILLRQDNADERLTRKAFRLKTVGRERLELLEEKENLSEDIIKFISDVSIAPEDINDELEKLNTTPITQKVKAINIAIRPQVDLRKLLGWMKDSIQLEIFKSERFEEILECAEIKIKYDGYIKREKLVADKIKRLESLMIPDDINYSELVSISTEGREKLEIIRPISIGQAGRISGVSPSDINILLLYMGR